MKRKLNRTELCNYEAVGSGQIKNVMTMEDFSAALQGSIYRSS
jgi:hypothetical protein